MKKNEFIENIFNSSNGIKKVIPNDTLFYKIQSKIDKDNNTSVNLLFKIAASVAVLITLNIYSLTNSNKNEKIDDIASIENTITYNNQLY